MRALLRRLRAQPRRLQDDIRRLRALSIELVRRLRAHLRRLRDNVRCTVFVTNQVGEIDLNDGTKRTKRIARTG